MALTKDKKKSILTKLKDCLTRAESVVFANFHGLKVAEATALRRFLDTKQVDYLVAKKTLLKRALADLALPGELPALDGEVAIAYQTSGGSGSVDLLAPVKGIYDFGKQLKEGLKILGGIFNGSYQSDKTMLALAVIPARETLYGQVVNLFNSPLAGLVIVLEQVACKRSGEIKN